ncbi:RHS repeat-associated core domain-containing protein [Brevundimonas sp. M20]|uniref:RHS repeat-associated core domain-containing protein n=1 Tax=Brevundimonas sp. M20 TaxID=2591463 RepID=UPI00143D0105|nr:RHS repeat-associated core domain-containing protein [Brevundimonas sp. M20]
MGLRRVMLAGLAGTMALGASAGAFLSVSKTGARAQGTPGYTLSTYTASDLPGFRLSVQQSLVSPGSGDLATVYGSPTSPTAGAPSARITALARALENDPDRIYQFVHNTILFEPQFGLHKGADGVLLDGSGGSFDQSQLMVELLRASSYQARFVLGQVNLSGADAKSILRVSNASQACLLLAAAGTPATVNGGTACGSMSGDVTGVTMLHLWVEANIGGSWYAFDPSLKLNDKITGIDLWDAAGTNAASAWNNISSGVSIGGDNLTGANAANIHADLEAYATALQSDLINSHTDKSLKQLTGGWEIVRTEAAPRDATLVRQAAVSARWTGEVPAPYRATLRVETAGFDHTFDLPGIYGWRVQAQLQGTLESSKLVVAVRKQDHLDASANAYFGTGGPNAACNTELVKCGALPLAAEFAAQDRRLDLTINHPYAARATGSPTTALGSFGDEKVSKALEVGKRADLLVRTGGGDGDRHSVWSAAMDPVQAHRIIPAGNAYECASQSGNTQTDPHACDGTQASDWRYWRQTSQYGLRLFPLGENAVAEMGTKKDALINSWTDLFDNTVRVMEGLSGARIFHQHSVGIAITTDGMENVLDIDTSVGVMAMGTDSPHHVMGALAALGAMEEGLAVSQIARDRNMFTGELPGVNASHRFGEGAAGLKVLSAPGATSSLPSSVHQDTRTQIERYLDRGFEVVATTAGTENAFFARRTDGSEQAWIIRTPVRAHEDNLDPRSAFRKGAESDVPNPLDYLGKAEGRRIAANVAGAHLGAVDLRSGSLSFSEGAEITVGQGDFPYSLSFSRSYSSSGPVEGRSGLGTGWTHNWESSVSQSSDVHAFFPEASVVSAAPMLVTAMVALQAARTDTLEGAVVGGIATSWLNDQAFANVINVNGGGQSARFVRLVSGAWHNPASPTETLSNIGPGVSYARTLDWTLSDRSIMHFEEIPYTPGTNRWDHVYGEENGRAAMTSWSFPTGVVITLAYTGQNATNSPSLTAVSNNLGAVLTFTNSAAPEMTDQDGCEATAALIDYDGGRRAAQQSCHEGRRFGGRIMKVSAGADEVRFEYTGQCPKNVNFCAFELISAHRQGLRKRYYSYGAPAGALAYPAAAIDYQQVLTQVVDEGVATPRARFDWRAVGGQVAPYVAESFDAQNRKTVYHSSTFTFSSARDAEDGVVRQAYDEDGRLIASADALGRTSRAKYDGPGRTIEIKTPYGDRTTFEFDRWGDLRAREQTPIDNCMAGYTTPQQQTWAANYWCATIRIEADYDPVWHKPTLIRLPATAADPTRPEWTLSYNSKGLVDVMTGPKVPDATNNNALTHPVWRTWYDSYGRPNRTQDPTGVESAMTYGGGTNPAFCLTRQVQGSQVSGGTISTDFTCDPVGNVLTTTVGGATTTAHYDSMRRKRLETGPAGTNIATKWFYDDNGDQTLVERWDSNTSTWQATTTTYSATHQPLTVTDPSGDIARTCYDLVDRPVMTIDPELRATRTVYNLAGQPTAIHRFQRASSSGCTAATELPTDVNFTETRWRRFEYNVGGMQAAEIDANGNRTEQQYDGLGRQVRTIYANTLQAWTASDQRGQVVARKQPAGHLVSLFYDAMGRDFHVREFGAAETGYVYRGRNTVAGYDLAGRPAYRDVSTQTTKTATFDDSLRRDVRNYTYNDGLKRLTAEQWRPEGTGGISYTTGYEYGDGRGNRTAITQPQSGGGSWTIDYIYDLANRVQTVSFPSASGTQTVNISHDSLNRRTGVDRPGSAADTTYAYDVDNDLTGMSHAFVAGTGPGATSFTYGRDQSGKVTSIGINQPVFEWMPTLGYGRTYGPASNMNRISSVSDAVESRGLSWNGDGDLSQEVRTPVGGGAAVTWTYSWTYGHRLAVVTNNAAVNPLTASYHYDSDDRRTKKVVNGVTTRTMWSGTDELAEYDVNGDLIRRFIPDGTGGMDQRLATVTASGAVYWHHTDHQGSVIATSGSDGQTVGTATYSPHGEGAPPAQSPFGYTGRQYDPETGLYYYRARYYSPYLGTFLSMDPIGTKDDPNLYIYVGLDPTNATDPTGRQLAAIGRAIRNVQQVGGPIVDSYRRGIRDWIDGVDSQEARDTEAVVTGDVVGLLTGGNLRADERVVVDAMVAGATGGVLGGARRGGGEQGGRSGRGQRGPQHHRPNPEASGPHSQFRTNPESGRVSSYETYDYPSEGRGVRVDIEGSSHGGIPTPHAVDTTVHVNPNDPSASRVVEGPTRPARPDEIPRGR